MYTTAKGALVTQLLSQLPGMHRYQTLPIRSSYERVGSFELTMRFVFLRFTYVVSIAKAEQGQKLLQSGSSATADHEQL